jgi:hypothetical protein
MASYVRRMRAILHTVLCERCFMKKTGALTRRALTCVCLYAQIEVQEHGMSDEYLTTLMDKLTALYVEGSEIDLKRARADGSRRFASPQRSLF